MMKVDRRSLADTFFPEIRKRFIKIPCLQGRYDSCAHGLMLKREAMKKIQSLTLSLLLLAGCGGVNNTSSRVKSNVQTTPDGHTVISNVQTPTGNWRSWVQLPPYYADCLTPCNGTSIEEIFHVAEPSQSGDATMFELNPASPYADALFSAQLIGQNSPQIPDAGHTILPAIHNFIYDSYFYVTKESITQVLEFDMNMYMNGAGMVWGTQCNHLGGGNWDIWDNVNSVWVSAGVPCQFVNGWNHVTLSLQRGADNTLNYQSIKLNETTYILNKSYPAGVADKSWWGVTANYQMDGNFASTANTTYVDNFTVTYW